MLHLSVVAALLQPHSHHLSLVGLLLSLLFQFVVPGENSYDRVRSLAKSRFQLTLQPVVPERRVGWIRWRVLLPSLSTAVPDSTAGPGGGGWRRRTPALLQGEGGGGMGKEGE